MDRCQRRIRLAAAGWRVLSVRRTRHRDRALLHSPPFLFMRPARPLLFARPLASLAFLESHPRSTMAVRFFATSSHLLVQKRDIVWRSTVTFMEDKPLLLLPLSPPVPASSSPVPTRLPQLSRAASLPGEVERESDPMAGRIRGREASERATGQASSPAGMALQGRTQS
ncbi:hypothetical protein OF846_000292 [Rhodotorula toruloides]|nr:hypothetical protein OF846_000292 [Rhodotorula toruloides]